MEQDLTAKPAFSYPWDMAVVVKDLDKTVNRLEALGIGPFLVPHPPSGGEGLFYHGEPLVSDSRALVARLGGMHLEIIQPDDKPNPWSEFLNTRGEGIHHVGFQVDDVEKEVARLTGRGAEVPFYGKINGKIGAAYVDLKTAGIVVELTSFCNLEQGSSVKTTFSDPWDIAVVVKDVDETVKHLEDLGIGPFHKPDSPSGGEGLFYRGRTLVSDSRPLVSRLGDTHLEIIQPDDKPNPWSEFLKTRGGGIHHVGFQVDDVEKEVARLTGRGAEVPFYGKINGKIGAAYVDLKIVNIVVELTSFSNKAK